MLLLLSKSPLRKAIRELLRSEGLACSLARPDADDLFEQAAGCETIIYAPSSTLLDGTLAGTPRPDRMRAVLGAANAPGCSTVVVVVPSTEAYEPELDVLRRAGKPYVVVVAPPLIEEVGARIAGDAGTLWIPETGAIEGAHASDVARAVLDACESEYQGRVERVRGEQMDLATLFREAADASARKVRVRGVWPPLHRAIRPVARWLRGEEPHALSLASDLERACAAPARAAT